MSASTWSLVVFGAVIGLLFFMLLYLDVASSVKNTFSSEQFARLSKLIDARAIEQSPTAMSFAAYAYAVTGAVAHNKLLLIPAGALLFFMQWPVLVIFLLWMVWGRMKYETLLSKLRVVDATRASAPV